MAGHPVAVTCVHPGGIKTAIARNMTTAEGLDKHTLAQDFDTKLAKLSPEKAARIILEGVSKKKPRVLVGSDAKVFDAVVRVTGSAYQRFLPRLLARTNHPSSG